MRPRALSKARFVALGFAALGAFTCAATASTQDAAHCLLTAERVDDGEILDEAEKTDAHEACLRALAATASVVQKYQFQEADFLITGQRR